MLRGAIGAWEWKANGVSRLVLSINFDWFPRKKNPHKWKNTLNICLHKCLRMYLHTCLQNQRREWVTRWLFQLLAKSFCFAFDLKKSLLFTHNNNKQNKQEWFLQGHKTILFGSTVINDILIKRLFYFCKLEIPFWGFVAITVKTNFQSIIVRI